VAFEAVVAWSAIGSGSKVYRRDLGLHRLAAAVATTTIYATKITLNKGNIYSLT